MSGSRGSPDEFILECDGRQMEGNILKDIKEILGRRHAQEAMKGKLRIRPECEIDTLASTKYMESGKYSDWEKIRMFKARIGSFITYSQLHKWYGKTNPKFASPSCPLCGAEIDSVGHITSNCPQFKEFYQKRHNKSSTHVLTSVTERYGQDNITDGGSTAIPEHLLPKNSHLQGSKPDGVIQVKDDAGRLESVILMEFKHPHDRAEANARRKRMPNGRR